MTDFLRRFTTPLLTGVLFLTAAALTGCDSGGDDTSAFVGDYTMVSLTDRTGAFEVTPAGTTFPAGEATPFSYEDDGTTVTGTITPEGTLSITETDFFFSFSVELETNLGGATFTETISETDSGTWSGDDDEIDLDGEDGNFEVSLDGDILTLSDSEIEIVFER